MVSTPNHFGVFFCCEAGVTTVLTGPGSANLIGGQWTCIKTIPTPNIDEMILKDPAGMKMALGEKGIPVTVGPILFSQTKFELREMTPKNPGILWKAGVKLAIQTDEASAVKYLAINAALAVREGLPEEEALKAITINAAEIIGVEARIGSLEAGKDADIVIYNGHPFDYQSVPEFVMVNGEIHKDHLT